MTDLTRERRKSRINPAKGQRPLFQQTVRHTKNKIKKNLNTNLTANKHQLRPIIDVGNR